MTSEVRALRGEIRHWRRGHANTKLIDVLSDAYIALFATLMFGSMATNVVLNVRRVSARLCTSTGCQEARSLLPWLAGLSAVLVVLSVARLFGPVFASPAVGSWLLPTGTSRLRSRPRRNFARSWPTSQRSSRSRKPSPTTYGGTAKRSMPPTKPNMARLLEVTVIAAAR